MQNTITNWNGITSNTVVLEAGNSCRRVTSRSGMLMIKSFLYQKLLRHKHLGEDRCWRVSQRTVEKSESGTNMSTVTALWITPYFKQPTTERHCQKTDIAMKIWKAFQRNWNCHFGSASLDPFDREVISEIIYCFNLNRKKYNEAVIICWYIGSDHIIWSYELAME